MSLGLVRFRIRVSVSIGGMVRVSFLGSFRVRVRFWLGPSTQLDPNIQGVLRILLHSSMIHVKQWITAGNGRLTAKTQLSSDLNTQGWVGLGMKRALTTSGAILPIILSTPKHYSHHFIFHRKCISFE